MWKRLEPASAPSLTTARRARRRRAAAELRLQTEPVRPHPHLPVHLAQVCRVLYCSAYWVAYALRYFCLLPSVERAPGLG